MSDLRQTYDRWYAAGSAHWENAPGKTVLVKALEHCCVSTRPLRLLDIGCGSGSFLARIQEQVSKNWKLYGVDFSAVAIEQARQEHPDFHFLCADASVLEYASNSFDIVTCYGSWEHFQNPARAISEAARILTPGGWIFAMIPALGVHRTDRTDEGWYEDIEIPGSMEQQMQWNLRRETWETMFVKASIQLADDSLARRCGAIKPGVFFFGIKLARAFESAGE